MWIIIWKNVYDSWSPWPGPRGCFGALSECEGAKAQYKTKTRAGKWQIYNLARANVDLEGEPLK